MQRVDEAEIELTERDRIGQNHFQLIRIEEDIVHIRVEHMQIREERHRRSLYREPLKSNNIHRQRLRRLPYQNIQAGEKYKEEEKEEQVEPIFPLHFNDDDDDDGCFFYFNFSLSQ